MAINEQEVHDRSLDCLLSPPSRGDEAKQGEAKKGKKNMAPDQTGRVMLHTRVIFAPPPGWLRYPGGFCCPQTMPRPLQGH